jgi:nucleotidyltransferase substrate binding protein (TIGR01987 family)
MSPDVRWKQRFANFDRAFALLCEALARGSSVLSALEKEGVVQRFEYTFELAWKLLEDFQEAEGVTISPLTPRQVIKDAFAARLLGDGQVWIDMLNHRNLLSHNYDLQVFADAVDAIAAKYLPAMSVVHEWFARRAVN